MNDERTSGPGDASLRVGVIGPGDHAQENLIPPLRLMSGVRLVGFSSRDIDKARALAVRWSADYACANWRELAHRDRVDAIVVAAPPAVHREVAMHCLEHGLHVFVDKPPAESSAALDTLIEREKSARALAFVGFNFPYGASYRHFLRVLEGGGEIVRLHVRFVSRHPRTPIWGCADTAESLLLSAGIHPLDMLARVLGRPQRVSAFACETDGGGLGVTLTMAYPRGAVGSIELGNHSNRFEFRCEALTRQGASGVLDQHNGLRFSGIRGASSLSIVGDGKEVIGFDWPSRRGGYERTGYQPMLESFRDSILGGRPSTSPLSACKVSYDVLGAALQQLRGRA